MGIFSKLFSQKKSIVVEEERKTNTREIKVPIREITTLIEILGNLGLLDERSIEESLSKKYSEFDYSILKRLMIRTEEKNVDALRKYFSTNKLGFGSIKVAIIKNKMYDIAREALQEQKNEQEVIEELIQSARLEIETYEKIISKMNETLKTVEDNSPTDADRLVLVDYWISYYKEQELGYPIDLDSKIDAMAKDLSNLPYGGYGENEIRRFRESAEKYVEEGKISGESQNQTHNRIRTALFEPKKSRYLSDVETLGRKLRMIDESPYLKDYEKDQNKEQLILEFNQMNGHSLNVDESIKQFKINLELLEYGGYGKLIIDEFVEQAQKISYEGKEKGLKETDVIDAIKREYNILLEDYTKELANMKERLKEVDQELISLSEKERKKNDIVEDFKDSMGHELDYKERINKMILGLKNLEHGGYGDNVISEFRDKAVQIIKDAQSDFEIAKSIKEIRKIYNKYINEYKVKTEMHYDEIRKVRENTTLTLEEKEERIDELGRTFKFGLGYRMNFDKIIKDFQTELSNLDKGGYGDSALEEFKNECEAILKLEIPEKDKYNKIKQKYSIMRSKYVSNLRIFTNWKMMRLKESRDKDKEALSKELDSKIIYMLSLSPTELNKYYMNDDVARKKAAERYNTIAACKFLARKEAEHHNNSQIYTMRLQEIKKGIIPYSKEKIDKAKSRLQMLTITNDPSLDNDTRLVSIIDYIDSTLLSQMLKAEKMNENNSN